MANPKRRLLDNAGRMNDEAYADIINQIAQNNYLRWGIPLEEAKREIASDNTYDYRGYYSKYPDSQANASTHWSDEFKGATHPTFSNESVYHGKVDKRFNPYGLRGGMWFGDVYQPHAGLRRRPLSDGGSIHIKPSKRGTFTAAATKHGMSVQGFANKVLANKDNYSAAMVKKANFAKNFAK